MVKKHDSFPHRKMLLNETDPVKCMFMSLVPLFPFESNNSAIK